MLRRFCDGGALHTNAQPVAAFTLVEMSEDALLLDCLIIHAQLLDESANNNGQITESTYIRHALRDRGFMLQVHRRMRKCS